AAARARTARAAHGVAERAGQGAVAGDVAARVRVEAERGDAATAWLAAHPSAARLGAGWDRVKKALAREAEAAAGQAAARRRDDALVAAQHVAETRRAALAVEHGEAVAKLEEAE